MPDVSARDAKLIQYLNEAYGTEKRLETALAAHITMTTRATYKKRLRNHLTETKRHGREVSKRIKQLGGSADTVSAPGPERVSDAAQAVVAGAQRAAALAQGPMHALRGTGEEEKQLKNAKTEYQSEAEEIATYSAIESLAKAVGDRDTERLARSILREEQRMFSFLEKEIPRLTAAVAKAEIPAAERGSGRGTGRRSSTRRASSSASGRASSSSRSRASSSAGSGASSARKPSRSGSGSSSRSGSTSARGRRTSGSRSS
jgi:ferritin-like metal-binding protein YciE